MLKFVAFTVLALTGAVLVATDPASSAAGARGLPGGHFRAPFIMRRNPRAGLLRPSPFRFARPPFAPRQEHFFHPTPRPFATTTPLHPFAHLARRTHRAYWGGWSFPITSTDDPDNPGYIGAPYDPAEIIPVYGPAPAADPAPARPVTADVALRNRDACGSESVAVPSDADDERTITVVRC
jgi:hypothetical protein